MTQRKPSTPRNKFLTDELPACSEYAYRAYQPPTPAISRDALRRQAELKEATRPAPRKQRRARRCTTGGCDNPTSGRRVCDRCRWRIRRYGDPHGSPRARATEDDITIDEGDLAIIVARRRPTVGLTEADKRLVAAELTRRTVSAAEIGRIVGVAERTVCRWRADARTGHIPGTRRNRASKVAAPA